MEAKCDGCGQYFPSSELSVSMSGGVYCFKQDSIYCRPPHAEPISITYNFSWGALTVLVDYLNGETNVETLMAIGDVKEQLEKAIYDTLKRVLKKEDSGGSEVQEPNP